MAGITVSLSYSGMTRADDDEDCDDYTSWETVSNQLLAVREGGLADLDPTGSPFERTQVYAHWREKHLLALESIPEKCQDRLYDNTLRGRPRLRLISWNTIDPYSPLWTKTSEVPDRLTGAYRTLQDQIPIGCRLPVPLADLSEAQRAEYNTCLQRNGPVAFAAFDSVMSNTSDERLVAIFERIGIHGLTTQDAQIISTYHQIVAIGGTRGSQAAFDYIRSRAGELNEDQWLAVAQMHGRHFGEDFNHPRMDDLFIDGSRTTDDLLRVSLANEMIRYRGQLSRNFTVEEWGGVCRDLSSAQMEILAATGLFKNVYVVARNTLPNHFHVTGIAQSIATPAKIYQLNYGNRMDRAAGDSRALFLGTSDISFVLRIAKPGGRVVQTTQSDFRKFLIQAAGGDIREYDALARAHGGITGGDLSLSDDDLTHFRMGFGSDGTGADYIFAAATQEWNADGNWPGRVGIVIGIQNRPGDIFQSGGDTQYEFFYLELEQHYRRIFKLGENLTLTSDTALYLAGIVGRTEEEGVYKVGGNGDGRIRQEFSVDHQITDNLSARYTAGAMASPAIPDIRDNSIQMPILALDGFFTGVEARYGVDNAMFLVRLLVAGHDSLGFRGLAEFGFVTRDFSVLFGAEGRINGDAAAFQDGWARKVYAAIQVGNEWLSGRVQVFQTVDQYLPPATGANIGIQGKF